MIESPLRILVVSPTPSWPLDHGNRKRVLQTGQALRERGHSVHFLYYPAEFDWVERIPHEALRKMQQQWDSFHIAAPTRPIHPPPVGAHHQLDEWWDPAVGTYLDWLFARDRFDAVLVNYVWLSRALLHAPLGTMRLLDTHDRVGGRKQLLLAQGIAPEFFYLTPEDEVRGLARADRVMAIKDEEAWAFRETGLDTVPITTWPFIERSETARIAPKHLCRGPLRIGLFGARNSLNRSGTQALLDELLARQEADGIHFRIVIAGRMAEDFTAIAHPAVEILGRVDDPATFYDSCDAVVVPLASSTGQKIRVGEALAYGTPVIAHAHAFEGYVPQHPFHALPSFAAIADAVIAAVEDVSILADVREAGARTLAAQEATVAAAAIEIEHAIRKGGATCLAVPVRLLASRGAAWLRFSSLLRRLATGARVLLWLPDIAEVATPMVRSRLVEASNYALICAASESAAADCDIPIWCVPDLISCLAGSGASRLWCAPVDAPEIAPEGIAVVLDDDLDDGPPRPSPCFGGKALALGSRCPERSEANRRTATPIFCGPSGQRLWNAPSGRWPVWVICTRTDEPAIEPISDALGADPRFEIILKQDCAREMAGMPQEEPVFVVACRPREWRDPFWLEFANHARIPAIVFDPDPMARRRRHLGEAGHIGELHLAVATWGLAVAQGLASRLAARRVCGEELLDPFNLV